VLSFVFGCDPPSKPTSGGKGLVIVGSQLALHFPFDKLKHFSHSCAPAQFLQCL